MSERQMHLQSRLIRRVVAVLTACCLILGVPAAAFATTALHKQKRPKPISSKVVTRCLRRVHLRYITKNGNSMWLGFDPSVGGFVYVQRYSTLESARTAAKFLADEESGLAHTLVISQHIAPYKGSPVPSVTRCLGGKMVSKPPKQTGPYKF